MRWSQNKQPPQKTKKKKKKKKETERYEKKLTTLNSNRNITFSLLGLNKNLMVLIAKWNLAGNYCLATDLKSNLLL